MLIEILDKTTFNESSFEREYESIWSGSVENAFFDAEVFDRNRTIFQPEYEATTGKNGKGCHYVLSVDVGRKGWNLIMPF